MKRKFKIMYPKDFYDSERAGKRFKVKKHQSIIMTDAGHFMVLSRPSHYDLHVTPLHEVIEEGRFDVVWR